ncbi:hypothetical protein PSTG_14307 [Puccinia striiformis f. sp. tritici PST-78]|uniref:Tyr recombinase domain-containing protein n=2 Tax=Puccinia striiformis f. sp. tritici PST-78 TaxID=1165861 RepID=A0A0L0UZD8_9BASI|nr:hypothetical protein PSTG_14307 [Puccinia striiformis f. sp. tritici PST-78]
MTRNYITLQSSYTGPPVSPRKSSVFKKAMLQLEKLSSFMKNGTQEVLITPQHRYFLRSYSWNSLVGFNTAVKKFSKFMNSTQQPSFVLPIEEDDLYEFCFWAGGDEEKKTGHAIASSTIEKYIHAISVWHLLHKAKYPENAEKRIRILLRSSAKTDALTPAKPKKGAVHLKHMIHLAATLAQGTPKERAILDLAITSFWGMARLAEVTYQFDSGTLERSISVLTSDVKTEALNGKTKLLIVLRSAKTSKPGEIQHLQLRALENMLCPVEAVKRRLKEAKGYNTPLFGYFNENNQRTHLTKSAVTKVLTSVWVLGGFKGISGHSFRVGGASLRNALGVDIKEICLIGRWVSDCYKLYIRPYSEAERLEAIQLIKRLDVCWENRL